MPKEKKETKVKKEKKEKKEKKSHKEKREKEREKNKELTHEVGMIVEKLAAKTVEEAVTEKAPKKVSKTVTETAAEIATTQKDISMVVHYDLSALVSFASPLATEEFTLELMQIVRKASRKRHCRRGVKEVVKALKKGHKGLVVIAGDISPIDIITHIPILCEDSSVPYIYIPSRADLGFACATKRPTSVVMIVPDQKDEEAFDYKEHYMTCYKKVKELE
ncbi:50S ribosomal protein L30e-like protein [Gigaspora rosea]|uniref:H/ACA ribonucleoprotein complex subunit 2 n=1 Tax=Gigaspora rosea TaxID=44941 RepID=A0A397UB62_9GLOM|nr:50S ribosomal protein L30e-like protein [Gigaspora rosea]